MAGEILVLVTCPAAESQNLARVLVEDRLAACVNIIEGVRSIYLWEGKLCNASEQLLVIKSCRESWDNLRDRIEELHSYDVPEIIAMPIDAGFQPYLDWLNAAVRAPHSVS